MDLATIEPAEVKRPLRRRLGTAVIILLLLPYALTPLYLVGRPVSTVMLWRWATGASVERDWVSIDAVPPVLLFSVIAAEDSRFCTHHGVDLEEIAEAMDDAEDGGRLRGGSTITQQTVKNLFLWSGRSVVRKLLELPLALWMDLILPKRRIFEIYLNIAEWGPDGQFGAEAGARYAFDKDAWDLTPLEAGLMAATLPNPVTRDAGRPSPGLRRLAGIYQGRAHTVVAAAGCLGRVGEPVGRASSVTRRTRPATAVTTGG